MDGIRLFPLIAVMLPMWELSLQKKSCLFRILMFDCILIDKR
jgi:hypothetical protein